MVMMMTHNALLNISIHHMYKKYHDHHHDDNHDHHHDDNHDHDQEDNDEMEEDPTPEEQARAWMGLQQVGGDNHGDYSGDCR